MIVKLGAKSLQSFARIHNILLNTHKCSFSSFGSWGWEWAADTGKGWDRKIMGTEEFEDWECLQRTQKIMLRY